MGAPVTGTGDKEGCAGFPVRVAALPSPHAGTYQECEEP